VNKCVCFDVSFEELKDVADKAGIKKLDVLQDEIEFGKRCGMCLIYAEKMLETGETCFDSFSVKRKP
jgi:bacterioferritin-associated ferredoxin